MMESAKQAARRLSARAIGEGFEPQALYCYRNKQGEVIYYRIRLKRESDGEKWIRPMYHNGKGWVLAEPEFPDGKPLYGLDKFAEHPGAPVLFVEGENKVETAAKLGILSTTSGGVSSDKGTNFSPLEKRVIIQWPDNHEPGREYMRRVAEERLFFMGCEVLMVDVAALNLPEGGDIVDALEIHGAEVVGRAIRDAKPRVRDEAQRTAENRTAPAGTGNDEEAIPDAIARLAELSPIEFDRVCKEEAQKLVCKPSTLEQEVKKARGKTNDAANAQGQAVAFHEIEPWAEIVNASALLDELAATFQRFVVLPEHAADALALWVAFTWMIDAAKVAPILALTSPEKRCGKTTVLALLAKLAYRAAPTSSISPSATFRLVEAFTPTLLIDEADTFIRDNEELRGVLNAGHTRDTAFVWRTVGEDHEPRRFSTWGAKAIALIGNLPDTLADRSIPVQMRRKLASESVEKLRHAPRKEFETLIRMLARFAADNARAYAEARPDIPSELSDRAQDNWEPLLAIADLAGGDWPKKARAAARHLSGNALSESESLGVSLLKDIRQAFEEKGVDRFASADLVKVLCEMEERPWVEICRGKGLTPNRLARMLGDFGITSRSIRLEDGKTPKGYLLESFQDSFDRYLKNSVEGARQTATTPQANRDAAFDEIAKRNAENVLRFKKPSNPAPVLDCGGVAFQKGVSSKGEDFEVF